MWFWAAGEKTLSVFLLLRQICVISWIISHFWRFCRNLFKTAWDKESCVSQSYACRIYFFFSGHQGLHLCVNVSPASVNSELFFYSVVLSLAFVGKRHSGLTRLKGAISYNQAINLFFFFFFKWKHKIESWCQRREHLLSSSKYRFLEVVNHNKSHIQ